MMVAMSFALGQLGGLGSWNRWAAWAFCAAGVWAGWSKLRTSAKEWDKHVVAVLAVIVGLRWLLSVRLLGHGDPLYYHLEAPRFWFQEGKVLPDLHHPITFLASAWEYLYLWPQAFFVHPPQQGLALAQWFSQWTHVWVGFGGSVLSVYALSGHVTKVTGLRLTCVALGAGAGPMIWTAVLAKNDWGSTFWVLVGVVLIARAMMHKKLGSPDSAWIGIFLGLGLISKITSLFAILPWGAVWIGTVIYKRSSRALLWSLTGGVLALTPFLLRNYLATGNPLFPASLPGLPNPLLGPTEAEIAASFRHAASPDLWGTFMQRVSELRHEQKPALWAGFPGLLLLVLWKRKLSREALPAWMAYLTAMTASFLFVLGVSGVAQLRLLGPGLVLLGFSLGATVAVLATHWVPSRHLRWSGLIPWLVMATNGLLPVYVFAKLLPGKYDFPHEAVLKDSNGYAKAWIRANVSKGDLIVTDGDNEVYYLAGHRIYITDKEPELDRFLRASPSDERIFEYLRTIQAKWFLGGPRFPSRLAKVFRAHETRFRQAVRFERYDQFVLDLTAFLK
jgi:hypothetical protein